MLNNMWHPDIPEEYRNQIITGDAKELSKRIPDESIDLIFTDPPYSKKFLYLYEWLAPEAKRILKPGGFCLALCGQMYLDQIFEIMGRHLNYFWKYEIGLSGWAAGQIWPHGNNKISIISRCKPLLAYSNIEKALPRTRTMGIFYGNGKDKRFHKWGQDVVSARYYIDCFSGPEEIIFDPFMGGGTTAVACKVLRRNYIGFEISPESAKTARERVLNAQPPLFVLEPEQLPIFEE